MNFTMNYKKGPEVIENYSNFIFHPTNSILKDLQNLFETKGNSDVTFIIDNQQIKAHKFLLQCRSIVFAKMFEHDMLKKETNKIKIVDKRPEIFNKMLEFIYTDKIEDELNINDAGDLLDLAEKYDLGRLKQLCGRSLFGLINQHNALEIYLVAEKYMPELLKPIEAYIKQHSIKVLKSKNEDYYIKNKRMLKLILELI